ncbi:MAG: pyridoxal phosphate-dependent aminotransferase [Candidatus Firestonebacteria bacterium]
MAFGYAKRMSRLGTENAFVVLAQVKKLLAQGKDIISFGLGEPDFDTPLNIKEAAIKAIKEGQTKYGPSAGILPLREAIARQAGKLRGIEIDPDEVVVTPGAKPIIFDAVMALVDEGDEVVYPNPGYPIYESVANFVGAKSVALPLWESKGFSFDIADLKKLVNKKTKMIFINSPQNPTGGVLSYNDLKAIAELAIQNDCWVVSDEVYGKIIYGEKFHSIASIPGMKQRTIIVDGFSKTYAMTGWRLGYGIMPKELAGFIAKIETNADSCTNTFVQYGGVEAILGPQAESDKMVAEFEKRSILIVDLLNDIKGFSCIRPKGAFYVFPNVTQACKNLGFKDARDLQAYLLEKAEVAVLARTFFGPKNLGEVDEYVRLSYVTSTEKIKEGLQRMKNLIEKGHK